MTRKGRIRLAVVFLLVLIGLAYFWRGDRSPDIEPGSTLVLRVGGAYAEAPTAPILPPPCKPNSAQSHLPRLRRVAAAS